MERHRILLPSMKETQGIMIAAVIAKSGLSRAIIWMILNDYAASFLINNFIWELGIIPSHHGRELVFRGQRG